MDNATTYTKHCARKGTTTEKMIAKIMRECGPLKRDPRVFPKSSKALESTYAYVSEYLRVNSEG